MPHPVDIHVGNRLKQLRKMRRMSQTDLGMELDLRFQQIQKYEIGLNRIAASKLYTISELLDVSPMYFFEGLEGTEPSISKSDFDLDSLLALIDDSNTKSRVREFIESSFKNRAE